MTIAEISVKCHINNNYIYLTLWVLFHLTFHTLQSANFEASYHIISNICDFLSLKTMIKTSLSFFFFVPTAQLIKTTEEKKSDIFPWQIFKVFSLLHPLRNTQSSNSFITAYIQLCLQLSIIPLKEIIEPGTVYI